MKKILVTGGAGFIGINLVHSLLKNKKNYVVVYDNLLRKGTENNLKWLSSLSFSNFKFIKGDIRNYKKLKQVVKDSKEVYHLAAQVAVTKSVEDPVEDFEINAAGTLYLLEAVRLKAPSAIVIFSSTNKVYGELSHLNLKEGKSRYYLVEKRNGIDERENLDFHSPYGNSKGTADQYVRDYNRIYGLKTVVFRQSCISENQEVVTPFGRKKISDLSSGDLVHCGTGWTKVKRVWKTGVKPVIRITTMNGLSVTLTEDHRVFRPHGLFSSKNLTYGDFLSVLPEFLYTPKWESIPEIDIKAEQYIESVMSKTSDKRCINKANELVKNLFPLKGDILLALTELIGYLFGDGHLGIHNRISRKKPSYYVQYFGREQELNEISKRLEWLGFYVSGIIRSSSKSVLPNNYIIQGESCRIQQQSIPLFSLFELLGVPVGDKVRVDYEIPEWILKGHYLIKRAFLRGFFGAELTKINASSYLAPSFSQSKDVKNFESGNKFIKQLINLLKDFDIETSCFEYTPVKYKRGTTIQTFVRLLGGIELFKKFSKIGFVFNPERSQRLNAILRWQWEQTSAKRFEIIESLLKADGELFWDSVLKIEPIGEKTVYDIEVEDKSHLFLAGGILVSNCIYGPHQYGNEDQGWVAHFIIKSVRGEKINIYGDGKQIRDVLEVSDLINAYTLAAKKIKIVSGQIYNVGGGKENTFSLLELIKLLEKLLGRKINCEFSNWRPGDQKVFISNNSKLEKELGWKVRISKGTGVKKLLNWVKNNIGTK